MSAVAPVALVLALSATRSALAEEAYDPPDTVYATGAVFATEEELADRPRTPLFATIFRYLSTSRIDFPGRAIKASRGRA